jgi:hypothetical protein
MSVIGGPDIITDGLVLYLDAANTKSYIGSGTTWKDLSRNSNDGTLTNGPTFDSGNSGSIVFDGVEIIHIEKNDVTQEEDLVTDIISLMASFSGKIYGRRSAERRKTK